MIEAAVLSLFYLIQGAGSTTFGAGVFFACGCTVYTKALVVVGITFPVLLLVVKAFSPFIALVCLYLLFPVEGVCFLHP